MTTVNCLLKQCRSWLNGRCRRTKVRIVGMRCTDFVKRRGSFHNITTNVYCDNTGCTYNTGKMCTRETLNITATSCGVER